MPHWPLSPLICAETRANQLTTHLLTFKASQRFGANSWGMMIVLAVRFHGGDVCGKRTRGGLELNSLCAYTPQTLRKCIFLVKWIKLNITGNYCYLSGCLVSHTGNHFQNAFSVPLSEGPTSISPVRIWTVHEIISVNKLLYLKCRIIQTAENDGWGRPFWV